jgi:hypothetical protein
MISVAQNSSLGAAKVTFLYHTSVRNQTVLIGGRQLGYCPSVGASVVCLYAAKVAPPTSEGKLVDFTEQRHGGASTAEYSVGMGSCVDRDYTVDLGTRIVVLRHSTCNPRINPAMRCEVGQKVFVVVEKQGRDERYGIIASKGVMSETGDSGKPVWPSRRTRHAITYRFMRNRTGTAWRRKRAPRRNRKHGKTG